MDKGCSEIKNPERHLTITRESHDLTVQTPFRQVTLPSCTNQIGMSIVLAILQVEILNVMPQKRGH